MEYENQWKRRCSSRNCTSSTTPSSTVAITPWPLLHGKSKKSSSRESRHSEATTVLGSIFVGFLWKKSFSSWKMLINRGGVPFYDIVLDQELVEFWWEMFKSGNPSMGGRTCCHPYGCSWRAACFGDQRIAWDVSLKILLQVPVCFREDDKTNKVLLHCTFDYFIRVHIVTRLSLCQL